jgi:diguanylate cyclase (GGDEF)-like protein/PAS domain S-box-containing protein
MRRWAVGYAVAAVPLVIATFSFPRYHLALWGLLGWSASVAILVGVVRNRPARRAPWLLMAVAVATFVTGDIVYDVLTEVLHLQNPFPSVADAFYLATYPLFACGLLGLIRARSRERTLGPLLDALIVTTSSALLSWIYLIQPYVHAADMTLFEKVVSISYPLGDIAILSVLARLLLSGGLRNPAVRLLTLGAVSLLAADVLYGDIQLNGSWQVGGPVDLGWVLFYVCWGAASLHPSMRELTEVQPPRDRHLSMTALVVLSGATLVAPCLLVWRAATDRGSADVGVIGVASGVVFLLVMARLTSLARVQGAQANRERALRAVGERLVAASELDEVDAAAVAAVESLVGSHVVACVVTVSEGRSVRVVAARPSALMGALVDRDVAGGDTDSLVAHLLDGVSVPDATSITKWSEFSFGGLNCAERRVLIGYHGPLPLRLSDVENVLAAQLTLAADRVQLAEDLHQRKSEARFRSLIRNATDVILVVQADGELRSETPSIEAVLGYGDGAARTLQLASLVHAEDGPKATASIEAMLAGTHQGPMHGEWRIRHADGRWLNMEVVGNDLSEDREVRGVVLTMRDVSDRKVLEDELRHQAFHDGLTNLANRVLFNDRVEHALSRRARLGNDVSVLLLDIDDFKVVNDTLGHAAGDELLVQFARRLLGCLRGEDTAARLGGDEFAVCVEGAARELNIGSTAQRIVDTMSRPFTVAATEVNARVSIGISMAGDNTDGSIGMLREADLALYAAKSAGKGTYHFFETSLHHAVLARLEQRTALEQAIQNDELRLQYQPIVNLNDGTMVGVEALVRWEHQTRGMIPPLEFIPLAEDSGLVIPLGRWVLDRACTDLSRWQRLWNADATGPFTMAVNVSPRQLQAADFLTVVNDTIRRHDIDPSWLTFEITESLLVQDSAAVMTRLVALHDLGIALALDDFGTGYSSLSYLHRFPIQILKIDRSFVTGMDEANVSANGTPLINAIVSMAQSLGLDLVAEGIENESQRRRLCSLGCTYGQGFHLSRPVPAEEIDELIHKITDASRTNADNTASARAE